MMVLSERYHVNDSDGDFVTTRIGNDKDDNNHESNGDTADYEESNDD